MRAPDIAVAVMLGISVLLTAICCSALLMFGNLFERLHYLSSVTTISTFALLIAVVIKEGAGQASTKAVLVFLVLLLVNAVLSHATARAARVREFGQWTPTPGEHIEGAEVGKQGK